jgi:hypothetical protein
VLFEVGSEREQKVLVERSTRSLQGTARVRAATASGKSRRAMEFQRPRCVGQPGQRRARVNERGGLRRGPWKVNRSRSKTVNRRNSIRRASAPPFGMAGAARWSGNRERVA